MKIGIFGLPFSGKTTVFEALSGLKLESATKPKGDLNRAVVKVPDPRLDRLYQYFPTAKKVPATVEYLEINGLCGKKSENGLSDSLLGLLRSVDALVHVVRTFQSDEVPHVRGNVDSRRDILDVNAELVFSDFIIVERSLDRLERNLKAGKKSELLCKKDVLLRCRETLEREIPLRRLEFSAEEEAHIVNYQFLSKKPLIAILNTGEGDDPAPLVESARSLFQNDPGTFVTAICGKLEMEIAQLGSAEQSLFLEELGLGEPALDRFIRESFQLLGLIAFFTVGDDEVRAWTLRKGSTAVDAAGTIHTDLARGFIRAEVFPYQDMVDANGSEQAVKKNGKMSLEGRDYVVKDGDILSIRFNVKKTDGA